MSASDTIADALALAFLSGPWNRPGLIQRATEVLGERPPWMIPLVRYVLARFREPPHDASQALSSVIQLAPSFRRANAPGQPRTRLSKLVVGEARMGRSPWPVPILSTSADLAEWLGVKLAELDWFADVRGLNSRTRTPALHHYAYRWLPKRSGGYRLVEAPKSRLKALQRRILHDILDRVPAHEAAHGFVRGRSVLTNASPHAGRPTLLRVDLQEFFPSVGAARVYRIFRSMGYPEAVARALTGLCTLKVAAGVLDTMPRSPVELYDAEALAARGRTRRRLGHRHLPQGAPTSAALANLAAYRMDLRLTGAARAFSATYTRYADDLAFSGEAALAPCVSRLEVLVAAIALEEGFELNHHKTRLMRSGQPQRLVGLILNQRPNVPREERKRLEATLYNAVKHGLESQNHDGDPLFLQSLRGRVAWVEHVNPAHARKLRHLLERLG